MGKRKSNKIKQTKAKKKKQNKKHSTNNNEIFRGVQGKKYNYEGKEQDMSDEDDEYVNDKDNEFFIYVNHYLRKIKTSSKTDKAKEYLQNFHNKNWKFNKNNQNFILKYILYEKVFPKEYFEIFKSYILNMHKITKDKFLNKCQEFISTTYKEMNNDNNKMTITLEGHELKFNDVDKKNMFLQTTHKRCVEIIENN